MAVYHYKFGFNGKTNLDYNLITATFDSDNDEVDGFLDMEALYSDSYDGTERNDYGAKFSTVPLISISLVKDDGEPFSLIEFRNVAKWLSGHRKVKWLDLYNSNDEIEYSFIGRFTTISPYMIDANCVGIVCEFESSSVWAYSAFKSYSYTLNGEEIVVEINNASDDEETYIYPYIKFENTDDNGTLSIYNDRTEEETIINNLLQNETIEINQKQIITSDNSSKIFGDDFNFIFLRLSTGVNKLALNGNGDITISYRSIMKVANALTDIKNTRCGNI